MAENNMAGANQKELKSETFVFDSLPKSLDELNSLPESDLSTPFKTAALTVAAFCNYSTFRGLVLEMLKFLKGEALSNYELQNLRDNLDNKDYVPLSYFEGSSPENNFTPTVPFTITISETPFSYMYDGYAQLSIKSSGAKQPRLIRLKKNDDKWYLFENFLLVDIKPKNPKNNRYAPWEQ